MVQVLELGLWGGQADMILLLPFLVEGLERLDKLLTLEMLHSWQGKLSNTSMALSLPRVNLTSALNLQVGHTAGTQQVHLPSRLPQSAGGVHYTLTTS